jgi:fused signal recognition particle receptor
MFDGLKDKLSGFTSDVEEDVDEDAVEEEPVEGDDAEAEQAGSEDSDGSAREGRRRRVGAAHSQSPPPGPTRPPRLRLSRLMREQTRGQYHNGWCAGWTPVVAE